MRLAPLTLAGLCAYSASTLAADPALSKNYQEPTRGFFIEHGTVTPNGTSSIELQTGTAGLSNGGGIRLGLSHAELIINSGINTYDTNEALLKWALPTKDEHNENGEQGHTINWAVLGGISSIDVENGRNRTNIKLGVSASVGVDAARFTVAPQVVHANGALDDTFIEVGIGAYVGVIDTASGLFSLGIEANITTQDNIDNQFVLGGRWAYNERINIDIMPVILRTNDITGLPGLVRLNVVF